jgi:hypothetical protein
MTLLAAVGLCCATGAPAMAATNWTALFNGRNLEGWDTYLGPPPGGGAPLGLNHDPRKVFTVVALDGQPAVRISGEIYGALVTRAVFTNFHLRLEVKWGEQRHPPRAALARDSGILYCSSGPHGAGSGAWMRSVECNIMEKGFGQWWSVADAIVEVEGERVGRELEATIPYQREGPGERLIVYRPGRARLTAEPRDGITPARDYEKPRGQWNSVEVLFWAGRCIHVVNGQPVMVLTDPRYVEAGRQVPLRSGALQLQSEGAECFYRAVEIRALDEIPNEYLELIPKAQDDETGFQPLFGRGATDGWTQCGPGHFELANGVATGFGGMGLWWHTNRMFTNFVLRGEWVQEQDIADSGVFVRFPDPGQDPWVAVRKGHELEIGDPFPADPTWRTGSIYPFKASVTANARPYGQWNEFELVCIGHDYAARINGRLVTTWSDPAHRSAAGYIGLQNYNDGKTVRHRRLRLKELP